MAENRNGAVDAPAPRRRIAVDVGLVVLAAGVGALLLSIDGLADPSAPAAERVLDVALGLIAAGLLVVRRRWPVAVAVGMLPATALALSATPATAIILFSVATRRSLPIAVLVALLQIGAALLTILRDTTPGAPVLQPLLVVAALNAVLVAWGQLTKARRELLISLRERAERAEAEQYLRVDHARQVERARIAREMHDVLAHRVSLVALHAGVIEVAPDAPAATIEQTAKIIGNTARQALEELREVIGVLRDNGSAQPAPQAPQPDLTTIERLVDEWRGAGAKIRLAVDVDQLQDAPSTLGRDAYRIVQEALTNVSKHAQGSATEVRLSGGPGRDLQLMIRNRLPLGLPGAPRLPGSGRGLVGLTERATISGGTLTHGPDGMGDFVVAATLPWSP